MPKATWAINHNKKVKLTPAKVRAIRAAYDITRPTHKELAAWYGVGYNAISSVLRYKTWKNVK